MFRVLGIAFTQPIHEYRDRKRLWTAPSGMFIKLSHQRFGDDRSENDNGHDRLPVVKKSTMKPQAPKPNNHLPANALRPKPGCGDRQAEIDIPSARRDKGPNLASSADDLRPGHRPSACVLRG